MPTYTYTCTSCNDVVEKRQSFSDPPLTTCEQCGGSLRKVIHPVGIVFKGSGWYITDSRKSSNGATTPAKDGAKEAADTSKKSEAPAAPAASGSDGSAAGSTSTSAASTTKTAAPTTSPASTE